ERLGVSGLVIGDKAGLKHNSQLGDRPEAQDTIESFATKIEAGIHARVTEDFLVMARVESLVLNQGMDDALRRAQAYVDAGADGIMVPSWQRTAAEVLAFCERYGRLDRRKPLIVAPSTC